MSFKSLKFQIVGVSPLLHHNGQLADPLNEFARKMKKVSGKRAKTDADFEELARLEWYGSLYLDGGKPCIPGFVIESAIVTAARKVKLGQQAQAGIICPKNALLHYKDEAPIDELWAQSNHRLTVGARIQRNRIMRTRPKFEDWSCEFELQYDDSLLNETQVLEMVETCGESVGLCDWRPKFGRFEVGQMEGRMDSGVFIHNKAWNQ